MTQVGTDALLICTRRVKRSIFRTKIEENSLGRFRRERMRVCWDFSFSLSSAVVALVFTAAMGVVGPAHGFVFGSQEEQWETDIREARSRARDFEMHVKRMEELERLRLSEAAEAAVQRASQQQAYEAVRLEFIRERNSRPSNEEAIERLERQHEILMEAELKKQEEIRRAFVVGREKVRAALERDAYIDEAREYDVWTPVPVEKEAVGKKSGTGD
jgi:hypothetical protein